MAKEYEKPLHTHTLRTTACKMSDWEGEISNINQRISDIVMRIYAVKSWDMRAKSKCMSWAQV